MFLEQPIAEYNGNPQVEDGHTKIANELLDAILIHDFTKRQLTILLFIIRKTYGWNKLEDEISRSQFTETLGFHNSHITTALQELISNNVIILNSGKHAKKFKINKYYDQWRITKRVIVTETVTVTKTVTITETVTDCYQNGNISLPKQYPQKTLSKDNTKDICFEVLNHLNFAANKNYRPVDSNINLIKSRLKDGFSKDELIKVINNKTDQWLKNIDMNQYLRPSTLFNATNFAQYSGEVPMKKKNGVMI